MNKEKQRGGESHAWRGLIASRETLGSRGERRALEDDMLENRRKGPKLAKECGVTTLETQMLKTDQIFKGVFFKDIQWL